VLVEIPATKKSRGLVNPAQGIEKKIAQRVAFARRRWRGMAAEKKVRSGGITAAVVAGGSKEKG